MRQQLLTAWHIHDSYNRLLINQLTEMDLDVAFGKGRNMGQQLAHMHNVRLSWLEHTGKGLYEKKLVIGKEVILRKDILHEYLVLSGGKIEALINQSWDNGGKLPSFQTGLIPFITYLVAHESHHRGGILQALKHSGKPFGAALKFGIWEWNKPPAENI